MKDRSQLLTTVFLITIFVIPSLITMVLINTSNPSEPVTDDHYKIMTFNIHFGIDTDGFYSVENIVDVVSSSGADIVGFQEITRSSPLNGFGDLGSQLTLEMEKEGFKYSFIGDTGEQALRNAIFSKYEILDAEVFTLEPVVSYQRTVVKATIDIDGNHVVFLVTHVTHIYEEKTSSERVEQINNLIDLADSNLPIVIMGDFNSIPGWPEIQTFLSAGYLDSWDEANDGGLTLTWPAYDPIQRLDYIFLTNGTSSSFIPVSSSIIDTQASDHLPVITEIEFV
ncbi:MAG: endonuclease/exonuclease/phosphatase family protein [Candidatus Kariarchaeaceae archaeon]